MQRCGIVDVGSNTIALGIYNYSRRSFSRISTFSTPVGLAAYVEGGRLSDEGIHRAKSVIRDYQQILDRMGIANRYAFATSPLRDLANKDEILHRLNLIGCPIRAISGEDEVRFDYYGAAKEITGYPSGLIVDIGGSSTELAEYVGEKVFNSRSYAIGSAGQPGASQEQFGQAVLSAFAGTALPRSGYPVMIGVGGTLEALGRILRAKGLTAPYPMRDILAFREALSRQEEASLALVRKLAPERSGTLLNGLTILAGAYRTLGFAELLISRYGSAEGFLICNVMKTAG